MGPTKRTLAIVALTTTLVSCSHQTLPATTPTIPVSPPRIYTTTAAQPLMADLTLAYSESHPSSQFEVLSGNYQVMLDMLNKGEIAYFVTNHLPENPAWAAPIAQDGIAIVTHPDIQLGNITLEQLRNIYQGNITNWSELGGADLAITVFSREAGSSTRVEFEQMVMGYRQITRNALMASSSEQIVDRVAGQLGGIGYVSMGYLDRRVQTLSINDSLPSMPNIYDGIYPLRSTVYVVGLVEPDGIDRHFIGWIQSPEGQSVVQRRYAPIILH